MGYEQCRKCLGPEPHNESECLRRQLDGRRQELESKNATHEEIQKSLLRHVETLEAEIERLKKEMTYHSEAGIEAERERKFVEIQNKDLTKRIYDVGLLCDRIPGLELGFCPDIGEPRDNVTRIKIALKRLIGERVAESETFSTACKIPGCPHHPEAPAAEKRVEPWTDGQKQALAKVYDKVGEAIVEKASEKRECVHEWKGKIVGPNHDTIPNGTPMKECQKCWKLEKPD